MSVPTQAPGTFKSPPGSPTCPNCRAASNNTDYGRSTLTTADGTFCGNACRLAYEERTYTRCTGCSGAGRVKREG